MSETAPSCSPCAAGTRLMTTMYGGACARSPTSICGGFFRFTTRNNIEFMVDDESNPRGPEKSPGGLHAAHRRHRRQHHQHRAHPGLGALPYPGYRCLRRGQGRDGRPVRVLQLPQAAGPGAHLPGLLLEHVRRRALLRHLHPGRAPETPGHRASHLDKMCEIPTTIAACPTAAIKPVQSRGRRKGQERGGQRDRCMFCGNCYTMCPAMPLADADGDGIALWVGGKVSNASSPCPSSPSWPCRLSPTSRPALAHHRAAIKKMVEVYADGAVKYERMGEWIERIGWETWFKLTDYRIQPRTTSTTTVSP
jgi:sulfite reductase beta subunit